MSAILTDSTVSKNDIIEFLKINGAKVFVVPLGVDEEFHPLPKSEVESVKRRYDLPRQYVLYVGDVNVNKNIPALLGALKEIPLPLVMVSSSISNRLLPEVLLIKKIIEEEHLEKKVIMLDKIPSDPNKDLVALYCGATVYVQPSFYEGFGLPVLEAMACGTPVVSSNAASLPEVAGNAAVFVDPTPQSIQKGIRKILESNKLRLDLQKKGYKRAKEMTWKKTARRTMSLYEDILL
jgi:alpha-1,3-rhamnosyl/mannosyltransferase